MIDKLIESIARCADACEREAVATDAEAGGSLHRWVAQNCSFRPGTDFFIVFLLAGELADRAARREGFDSNAHRAASRISRNFRSK